MMRIEDTGGRTALMLAAMHCSPSCVRFLLEAGADVKTADENGETALMRALELHGRFTFRGDALAAVPVNEQHRSDQIECVRLLLEDGADVAVKTVSGRMLLTSAASRGLTECVRLLLEFFAQIDDAHAQAECTALILAADGGHADCVRLLVDSGAAKKLKRFDGYTALMCAAFRGNIECLRVLVEAGAYTTGVDGRGRTALILAASHVSPACMQLLLDVVVDPNAADDMGLTTLMHVISSDRRGEAVRDRAACVSLLLECDAKPDARDISGRTALIIAASNGNAESVQLLARRGNVLNAKDKYQRTALIWAVVQGNNECVRLLLRVNGIDATIKDDQGFSALGHARAQRNQVLIDFLLGDPSLSAEGW